MEGSRRNVVFSGHRAGHGSTTPVIDPARRGPAIRHVMAVLLERTGGEPTDGWVGGADGFDLDATIAILALRHQGHPFRLRMVLPWGGFLDGHRHEGVRAKYDQALARMADDGLTPELVVQNQPVVPSGGRDIAAERRLLFRRNMELTDHLVDPARDLFLVQWDGVEGGSGTWNTIRHARSARRWRENNLYKELAIAMASH